MSNHRERVFSGLCAIAFASACVIGCSSGNDDLLAHDHPGDDGNDIIDGGSMDSGPVPSPKPTALCVGQGRSYLGFANEKLENGGLDTIPRDDARAGSDRVRIKPYRVLNPTPNADYTMAVDALLAKDMVRALGTEIGAVDGTSILSALGALPDRWFIEPSGGAVPLYATYVTAFKACTKYVKLAANTRYKTPPTTATAASECAAMQTKFWSRTPTQIETVACAGVALDASNDLASGTTDDNAYGRWAAACAAVLSAEGFVTY